MKNPLTQIDPLSIQKIVYKLFLARHCTLKNLIPGNSYRVYIRTINSATIDSDWNYQDFETKSDIPSPPDNISVTAVQSQMVSIAWKAPSDNGSMITGKSIDLVSFSLLRILGYEVEVCSGSSKSIQYTQPSQLTFEHSNLNANTEYTFRVAATNKIGRSGKILSKNFKIRDRVKFFFYFSWQHISILQGLTNQLVPKLLKNSEVWEYAAHKNKKNRKIFTRSLPT